MRAARADRMGTETQESPPALPALLSLLGQCEAAMRSVPSTKTHDGTSLRSAIKPSRTAADDLQAQLNSATQGAQHPWSRNSGYARDISLYPTTRCLPGMHQCAHTLHNISLVSKGRDAWTSNRSVAADIVHTTHASNMQHYTISVPSTVHIVAILHGSLRNVCTRQDWRHAIGTAAPGTGTKVKN